MQETSPPIPRQPIGTTFVVAMALLGAFAIVQVLAVLLHFAPALSRAAQSAGLEDARRAAAAQSEPAASDDGLPQIANPQVQNQMRAQELYLKASEALQSGNQPAALEFLSQANQFLPNNTEILVGLARLQTALKRPDASDTWQRILSLGPDAAPYRAEAETQLSLLGPSDQSLPSDLGGSGIASPQSGGMRDAEGLQPGSTLGIVDVRESGEGTGFKTLKVAIKSRPNESIDVEETKIHVYFYEDVNGDLEQARSRILYDWMSQPADWAGQESMELLQVKYQMPDPAEVAEDGTTRDYYGYMVLVYYQGQLQDFRAVPVDLRDKFPPQFDLNESPE